jgi:parallel beta-helix repeat protein
MSRKVIIVIGLCALLVYSFVFGFSYGVVKASVTMPVRDVNTGLEYASIQDAIDAPETFDGHTILVDAGTYDTNLVVDKSLTIIGSGSNTTVINGVAGGEGSIVDVVASNVLIEGFAINGSQDTILGVYFDHSDNSVLLDSNVSNVSYYQGYAVYGAYSNDLTVDDNVVGPNSCSGILITNSMGFNVSNNQVYDNGVRSQGYGINANASSYGLISGNDVYGNSYDGIGLGSGSENVNITRNNIRDNKDYGVNVIDTDCVNNLIYDNNITNNGIQAYVSNVSANSWDNGVEGNYWSDYQTNYPSASEIDDSGIWNTAYVLSADDADNYPLMGPISVFDAALGFDVDVVSNSSIASFAYFLWNGTVAMQVKTTAGAQIYGFCRVRLPHGLMTEPYSVTVDGAEPLYLNTTVFDDGVSRWIYFLYSTGVHEVVIRGPSPPATVSIISPENKTYTVSDVPLAFAINEETSLAYSLDGRANVTIIGNVTLSGVSNGTHTLVLYARNSFGNTSASGVVYFTVSVAGSGLFPFLVAAAVAVVVVLALVLVYFRKLRRKRGKKG